MHSHFSEGHPVYTPGTGLYLPQLNHTPTYTATDSFHHRWAAQNMLSPRHPHHQYSSPLPWRRAICRRACVLPSIQAPAAVHVGEKSYLHWLEAESPPAKERRRPLEERIITDGSAAWAAGSVNGSV